MIDEQQIRKECEEQIRREYQEKAEREHRERIRDDLYSAIHNVIKLNDINDFSNLIVNGIAFAIERIAETHDFYRYPLEVQTMCQLINSISGRLARIEEFRGEPNCLVPKEPVENIQT